MNIDKITEAELVDLYKNASSKIVLLDYDGTLTELKQTPGEALPAEPLLNILDKLANAEGTDLIIVTGRDHMGIDKMLGHLPVAVIAGHGAMMKENGIWRNLVPVDLNWKDAILPLLRQMTLKCPGSFYEEKYFSLAWHYRNAEPVAGDAYSKELVDLLGSYAISYNLKILDGSKVIEIMKQEIGKGNAVKMLLERKNYNFVLSIGDDVTDEEIFELLRSRDNAVTIKVGRGESRAKYQLNSVGDVILFLNNLN